MIRAMTHRKKVDDVTMANSYPLDSLSLAACACQPTRKMKQLNASKLIHKRIELRIHVPTLNVYKNTIKCFYQHLDLQCRLIYYKFTLLIVLNNRYYSHSRQVNMMAEGVITLCSSISTEKKRTIFFFIYNL